MFQAVKNYITPASSRARENDVMELVQRRHDRVIRAANNLEKTVQRFLLENAERTGRKPVEK